MKRPPRNFAGGSLALCLAVAAPLRAEEPLASSSPVTSAPSREAPDSESSTSRAAARALMKEGNALYASGDIPKAFERYRAAWERARGFDIACNLGRAAADLHRARDAAEYLDYCLRHYSLSSREEVVQAEHEIRKAFESAKSHVGAISVTSEPGGAEVFVDGTGVGRDPLGAPLFVDPGAHELEARLTGHESARSAVTAAAGQDSSVRLELAPIASPGAPTPASPPADAPPEPAPTREGSYAPALIAAGAGVVGLSMGIGFLVAAGGKDSTREDELAGFTEENPCGAGTSHVSACARIEDLSGDATTFRTVSYAGFGVAVVGAAATFLLWPHSSNQRATELRVAPIVALGTAGIDVSAVF